MPISKATLEEMKNRISMALKDPILQQGFEIICKENEELKEELKDANEKVVYLACNQNKDLKYKLTKAKELLKRCYENYIYLEPLRGEIKQFLKEIEK